MKTCAFTGHMPEGFVFGYDEDSPICKAVKIAVRNQIERLYDDGYKRFITGCALGVDIWAGESVIDLKRTKKDIELIGAVPFKGQERGWTEEQRERYEALLKNCDDVVTVSKRFNKNAFYIRDRYMVDNADIILAVYDDTRGYSGTGYTVRYAMGKDKPLIIIDPETFEVTKRNFRTE